MILEIILLALMLLFIIYPIIVMCHIGFSGIVMFWFALALICFICALLHRLHITKVFELTPFIVWSFVGLISVLLVFFVIMSSYVCSKAKAKASPGAEYILVIGDSLDGNNPGTELEKRLDSAYEYWKNNKDAIIIVAGGQADGEKTKRSVIMRSYLIKMGVDSNYIMVEDMSLSTYESVSFGSELIESTKAKTVIVTNGYSAFRANAHLKNKGFTNTEVIAVDTKPILRLNYIAQEVFFLIGDIVKYGLTL